jgi:2-dehydropantoate 2-reductase
MPVTIWGSGAIGGTLGAHMVRAGQEVVFVDRDADHVRAMRERGLRIEGFAGTFTTPPLRAYLPEEVPGPLGAVVLAVKAMATEPACRQIAPLLAPDGFVVSLQNGLNEPVIAAVVGAERTVGAFVNFSADYLEPGVIAYGGAGTLAVGEVDGRITPRVEDMVRRFRAQLPDARATDNVLGYLWSKMGYGCMLFGTALADATMADAVDRYRRALSALGREPLLVARRLGIRPLPFDGWDPDPILSGDPARIDASLDELIARMRTNLKVKSGIWRDLAVRHRRTEVDYQVMVVVAEGRRLGVPTPLCEACGRMIKEIEDGRRQMSWANLDELAALVTG